MVDSFVSFKSAGILDRGKCADDLLQIALLHAVVAILNTGDLAIVPGAQGLGQQLLDAVRHQVTGNSHNEVIGPLLVVVPHDQLLVVGDDAPGRIDPIKHPQGGLVIIDKFGQAVDVIPQRLALVVQLLVEGPRCLEEPLAVNRVEEEPQFDPILVNVAVLVQEHRLAIKLGLGDEALVGSRVGLNGPGVNQREAPDRHQTHHIAGLGEGLRVEESDLGDLLGADGCLDLSLD